LKRKEKRIIKEPMIGSHEASALDRWAMDGTGEGREEKRNRVVGIERGAVPPVDISRGDKEKEERNLGKKSEQTFLVKTDNSDQRSRSSSVIQKRPGACLQ